MEERLKALPLGDILIVDGFLCLFLLEVFIRFLYASDVGSEISLIFTRFLIVFALTLAHCCYRYKFGAVKLQNKIDLQT